jgi:hypothetical protein
MSDINYYELDDRNIQCIYSGLYLLLREHSGGRLDLHPGQVDAIEDTIDHLDDLVLQQQRFNGKS